MHSLQNSWQSHIRDLYGVKREVDVRGVSPKYLEGIVGTIDEKIAEAQKIGDPSVTLAEAKAIRVNKIVEYRGMLPLAREETEQVLDALNQGTSYGRLSDELGEMLEGYVGHLQGLVQLDGSIVSSKEKIESLSQRLEDGPRLADDINLLIQLLVQTMGLEPEEVGLGEDYASPETTQRIMRTAKYLIRTAGRYASSSPVPQELEVESLRAVGD